jgi:FAD/FMN-containing dehydrogenase
MKTEAIAQFSQALRGDLIGREHAEYDAARKLYNGAIDKHPLLIARCVDAADVVAAVRFGRENKLPIAVRGGGHNGPGLGSVDDGLVIDLSQMRGVRVDPAARTVRVAAGCVTGDVDHATHAFGLAVPFGVVSTTGVAGLTLSGGHGYLSRQYGLTIDSLIEADVVLADGRFVSASETENADLLWALRGGGGNFGVVTSFLFRAHPCSMIYGGPIFWELGEAAKVMRWYRDFQTTAPEDLCVFLGLQKVPAGDPFPSEHWDKKVCVLMSVHNGTASQGERAVQAMRDALPKPMIDWTGPMPFPVVQSLFDGLYPKGLHWYWKGDFVKDLPDEAIETHIAHADQIPSALSAMHIYPIDGAVHRRKKTDTAWNARDARWSMVILGVDADPAKSSQLRQWARDYWAAAHPFNLAGGYPNFMMDDEGRERLEATFGDNYPRLMALKKKFDPDNLFRVNQNIRPGQTT